MSKTHKIILKITLTAMFAALAFVGVLINIPIPSPVGKPMIHFGNFIVMLAALIFSGPLGGLAGAIGMGYYDISTGYGIWTLKTVFLKFGIGFVTGTVFKWLNKKDRPKLLNVLLGLGILFIVIGGTFLTLYIINDGIVMINSAKMTVTWPTFVFPLIIGVFMIVVYFIGARMKDVMRNVMLACSAGFIFNLIGEFLFKILKSCIAGTPFMPSVFLSIASLPSTIINGAISMTIVILLYPAISAALNLVNKDAK